MSIYRIQEIWKLVDTLTSQESSDCEELEYGQWGMGKPGVETTAAGAVHVKVKLPLAEGRVPVWRSKDGPSRETESNRRPRDHSL